MTDFSEQEFEDFIRRFAPQFAEGLVAGRAGLPGSALVFNTKKWGPIEGVREGNSIRWDFPDHSWAEARFLEDGSTEFYQNDRLAFRHGPLEIMPEDTPEAE